MDFFVNQLKKIHFWSSCTLSLINNTVRRWMYENGSIQRSNIRTYELVLKSALKTYLWSSWTIFLTNNTIARWLYGNGSIQRSYMRKHELVLKKVKILIGDLDEQYSLPIILLGVENTKMEAFNALTSGHRMSCLNQLKNSFVIFLHNILYQ